CACTYGFGARTNAQHVDCHSMGVRLEAEPEFVLAGDGALRWSIYGLFGFAFGSTRVPSHPATFDADTTMVGLDLGIGTRLHVAQVEFGLGALFRTTTYDQSESVGGLSYARVD